jgi:uncharacterized membrane protein
VIDHRFLGVHHVHPGAYELVWDLGSLAFDLALILGGLAMIQRDRR